MPNYQQTTIIGHLGRDPESRYTQGGDQVCNFSVAVTEKWGGKETTTWFRVNAWKKLAEVAQNYLKKGDAVMVVGRMNCRQWEDKDGQKRESWELTADQLRLMGARSQPKEQDKKPAPAGGFEGMDDDIPFMRIDACGAWRVI